MPKQAKHKGIENPAYIAAMRELRRSSASGTHKQGTARERSRAAAKRAAIERA